MTITILPDAQEDIKALRKYMLKKWGPALWTKAKQEIFSKFEDIHSGTLNGFHIPELASLGIDAYQQTLTSHHRIIYQKDGSNMVIFLVAGQRQDFKSLLQRRVLNRQ